MLQDFVIAVRTLLKRPGFALSVIATLTLGIGATTMMFSLLDGALLRPLPFPASGLVMLTGVSGPQRSPRGGSFPEVADWRAMNQTLDDVSIYDETSVNMRVGTESVRVETEMVSSSFFRLLGVQAERGRTFLPEEDAVPDRQAVAVVSHALWRERLGSDPDVLTRTVYLNDRPFHIVGVMPERFAGVSFDTDLWVPSMMVSLTSAPAVVSDRGTRWLGALGRLKTGVPLGRAQDDLSRVAGILERQYPDTNRQRGVDVAALREALLGGTGGLVVTLFGAVLLFLFVACANVASLQLARAAARRRDLAVRLALGARRWHVLRALMAESLLLSAAAGVFGAIAAAWTLGAVIRVMPEGALPRHVQPAVDLRALTFTLAVTAVVGVLVAILPGLTGRRDLSNTMKEGARFAGPGLGSIRRPSAQQLLVAAEIALAMILLTAAGLMVRSLERQMGVAVGFDARSVTVGRLSLPAGRYAPPERLQFVERLSERLRAVPRVSAASVGTSLPFTGNSSAGLLLPDNAPTPESTIRYYRNMVTPSFFSTLGIRVVSGRAFTERDRQGAPLVAVINEAGAKRMWGGSAAAIGRHFKTGAGTLEIVGVAEDARFRDLTSDLRAAKAEPDMYLPYAQRPDRDIEIAVRSADGAAIPLGELQRAVAEIDAGLPLYRVQRLEDALGQQTSSARFGSSLLVVFSGGAVLLAGLGLYGLISYLVGLSQREIAIRLALGADARRVIGQVLRNAMTLVGAGLIVGVIGAVAAGHALESQLFHTRAADPSTLMAVAGILLMVTLMATLLPMRRAVRVDPQSALRAE